MSVELYRYAKAYFKNFWDIELTQQEEHLQIGVPELCKNRSTAICLREIEGRYMVSLRSRDITAFKKAADSSDILDVTIAKASVEVYLIDSEWLYEIEDALDACLILYRELEKHKEPEANLGGYINPIRYPFQFRKNLPLEIAIDFFIATESDETKSGSATFTIGFDENKINDLESGQNAYQILIYLHRLLHRLRGYDLFDFQLYKAISQNSKSLAAKKIQDESYKIRIIKIEEKTSRLNLSLEPLYSKDILGLQSIFHNNELDELSAEALVKDFLEDIALCEDSHALKELLEQENGPSNEQSTASTNDPAKVSLASSLSEPLNTYYFNPNDTLLEQLVAWINEFKMPEAHFNYQQGVGDIFAAFFKATPNIRHQDWDAYLFKVCAPNFKYFSIGVKARVEKWYNPSEREHLYQSGVLLGKFDPDLELFCDSLNNEDIGTLPFSMFDFIGDFENLQERRHLFELQIFAIYRWLTEETTLPDSVELKQPSYTKKFSYG